MSSIFGTSRLVRRTVTCGGCGAGMQQTKKLARVVWEWDDGQTTEQVYLVYECHTPDCGTTVQVETD